MDECNLWSRVVQQFHNSCKELDGLWIKRRRIFTTETLAKGLLHLVGGAQKSYCQVLDQLDFKQMTSPAASSFCEARAKLPSFMVGDVRRDILEVWNESSSPTLWYGYRLHAVDGTKVALPRPLFKFGFKAPSVGYCPQGLVSTLVRLDDKMVCDIRLSEREDERQEAHEHLAFLSRGDLVIYDRGYLSFALLTAHAHQGIEAVFRVASGTAFLPIQRFWKSSKQEAIVTIDPTLATYCFTRKRYPEYVLNPIRLRLVKYHIEQETYVLATTIINAEIPRDELSTLYSKRWWVEESYKAFKQTLQLETFHSQTKNGIEQEVESTALFWNLARILGAMADQDIKKTFCLLIFITLPNQLPTMFAEGSSQFKRAF